MLEMDTPTSDVARLLSQIGAEYDAGQRGLSGLCQGMSQHRFITARMERMEELHQQLRTLVGERAIALVATHLDACADPTHQAGPAAPPVDETTQREG
jgi:hypothetical protein